MCILDSMVTFIPRKHAMQGEAPAAMKAKCEQLEVERDCLRREANELRDLLKTARCTLNLHRLLVTADRKAKTPSAQAMGYIKPQLTGI